jgi:hypothetical protein
LVRQERRLGGAVIKRQLFGWLDQSGKFRISHYPPDAPVRPSIALDTLAEVDELVARKRTSVFWSPPLPDALMRERSFAAQ